MKIRDDHPGRDPDPFILPESMSLLWRQRMSPTQWEAAELLEPGRNDHFARTHEENGWIFHEVGPGEFPGALDQDFDDYIDWLWGFKHHTGDRIVKHVNYKENIFSHNTLCLWVSFSASLSKHKTDWKFRIFSPEQRQKFGIGYCCCCCYCCCPLPWPPPHDFQKMSKSEQFFKRKFHTIICALTPTRFKVH